LAEAELLRDYNWTSAERDYKRAVELDPGYLPGHVGYALHLLTPQGRFAEARGQYAYADRVTPKSIGPQVSEALTAYYDRRFADSAAQAEEIRKRVPGIWAVVEILAASYISIGQPEKAVALLTNTPVVSGDTSSARDAMLGIAYARMGKRDEALRQLQQIERPGASTLNYTLATLSAAVGLNDKAMNYLEKAYANKETSILFVGVDPLLDPLKQDMRFQQLLSKMNLR
jgi:serine/threonine-protein kinase